MCDLRNWCATQYGYIYREKIIFYACIVLYRKISFYITLENGAAFKEKRKEK